MQARNAPKPPPARSFVKASGVKASGVEASGRPRRPAADHALEDVERHRARRHQEIVVTLEIEAGAHAGGRLLPQPVDSLTPDHVGAGLAGLDAIAFDLGGDRALLVAGR